MLPKIQVLKNLEIGKRVAEEESDQLEKYFVETDQWQQMVNGNIDVVYGSKGSGKSAIYTLLNKKENELFDKGILVSLAENVRGATVFRTIVADPPPSEFSFVYLWKIYCLILISRTLREYEIGNEKSKSLIKALEKAGLLPVTDSLSIIFRAVTNYFKGWVNRDTKAVEYAITIEPSTGAPTFTRKTEFAESSEEQNLGDIPVEELFEIANKALELSGFKLWILFDRLDVAFAESQELEKNALRALFRAYNDLKAYDSISLKIFVRDDIWKRITSGGFTEASHIIKTIHITWTEEGLLNLIILRLLNNKKFVSYVDANPDEIKIDYKKQRDLFKSLVPEQIDSGKNPSTFKWILTRTTDSSGNSAPREIIHLLEVAKDLQIKKIERGEDEPPNTILFSRASFKEALPTVSKVRYEQTLLAEYPEMREFLQKLERGKTEQTITSLSALWQTDVKETLKICTHLTQIGFFETRGRNKDITFWVPFLYRNALNLVQGKAEDITSQFT